MNRIMRAFDFALSFFVNSNEKIRNFPFLISSLVKKGDPSLFESLYNFSCTQLLYFSEKSLNYIRDLRESCGGFGFHKFSGIPSSFATILTYANKEFGLKKQAFQLVKDAKNIFQNSNELSYFMIGDKYNHVNLNNLIERLVESKSQGLSSHRIYTMGYGCFFEDLRKCDFESMNNFEEVSGSENKRIEEFIDKLFTRSLIRTGVEKHVSSFSHLVSESFKSSFYLASMKILMSNPEFALEFMEMDYEELIHHSEENEVENLRELYDHSRNILVSLELNRDILGCIQDLHIEESKFYKFFLKLFSDFAIAVKEKNHRNDKSAIEKSQKIFGAFLSRDEINARI